MALPATNHVVRIPELLSRIFSFSTTKDNNQNLLVCKLWSNEVLSIEWNEISEPDELYRLLSPLKTLGSTSSTCFRRPLTPKDWVRFDHYAWRIKSLDLCSTAAGFSMSIYSEIAATRNRLDFLPNLRTLFVPAVTIMVQLFAHASVTSFTVRPMSAVIGDDLKIKGAYLFSQIRDKMPNLQSLSIDLCVPSPEIDEIQTEAALTLCELKKLSYLALPPAWIRDGVTIAASELSNLHTLDIEYLESSDPLRDINAPLFSTRLTTSSFPSLRRLVIWISFPRAVTCFSQAFRPTLLETIGLDTTQLTSREDVKQLIAIIGSSCLRLTVLTLEADWASFTNETLQDGPRIEAEDLKPLSSCRLLRRLHLVHHLPFALEASEIVKLLEPLQRLEILYLNAMPGLRAPPSLHISCLSSIVSTCPSLRSLGLYVNMSSSGVPEIDPLATSKGLKALDLGCSKITEQDAAQMAFYLGHLLPQDCEILSFYRSLAWDKVRQLAPMFRKAVENGRQRLPLVEE